jgi:Ca2+-binding RTX toxin-like protein
MSHGLTIATVALLGALAAAVPAVAMTSHAGWPANQHLVMDKGPAGRHHTLVGVQGRHNYLLGGYGDDTIYGGNTGDVIWGDYHPSGESTQTAVIHAGNGKNFIYSNDTVNFVWTGTNPATVVHAHEGSGVIHCESPGIVVFTSHHALPHYKLDGCRHISFYSVGY